MAKQTKIELVQINARLASENEALRKQVADLQMSCKLILEREQAKPAPAAPKPARAAYVMPAWQAERAAAMAKAKAAAMLMGRTVSVGQ